MKHTLSIKPKVKAILNWGLLASISRCTNAKRLWTWSFVQRILPYCSTFCKTWGKIAGTLLDTGANIMKDVAIAKGRNLRKLVEKRGKQGGLELLNKVKTRMDSGQSRKRKRVIKDSDHSRSKQRRISNETKSIKGVPSFKVIQPQSTG